MVNKGLERRQRRLAQQISVSMRQSNVALRVLRVPRRYPMSENDTISVCGSYVPMCSTSSSSQEEHKDSNHHCPLPSGVRTCLAHVKPDVIREIRAPHARSSCSKAGLSHCRTTTTSAPSAQDKRDDQDSSEESSRPEGQFFSSSACISTC